MLTREECLDFVKRSMGNQRRVLIKAVTRSDLCFKEMILAAVWRTESREGARVRNQGRDDGGLAQDDGSRGGFYIWR